jgi:nitroreductase
MDTFDAITKRRSVRDFTGDPIPREDLLRIVDAGRLAATGSNRQPWDFLIVTERALIPRLMASGKWMEKSAAIIAVVMDPASRWWVEDGAAAIENMLLAATALGYGTCWVEGDALPLESQFKKLLGIPEKKRLLALIPVGVPTAWPKQTKKSLDEIIHWEHF